MKAHPEYLKRMIAAYVIGYSITEEYLKKNSHLKFAKGADDTGVIISWNTEGPGNKDKDNIVVLPGAISINPLNWKRDDTYASAKENLGAYLYNYKTQKLEIVPNAADAQVDLKRGVVITTTKGCSACNRHHRFRSRQPITRTTMVFTTITLKPM